MNHLLHYLETRPETKMKFGLERSHMLYEQVKKNRCPFITIVVGGTNGKGSICSFLASIYQSHGYKVGIFTSPHLVDLRERITVNGMPISEKDFLHYGNLFMKSHDPEEMDASYFETLTFFAYEYFAEKKVEVAIFEVGLGGRLDSTNALDKDAVVLGKVDLDHTQLLGETLEQIAKEKIALVRGHESVVIARQEPSAQKAIEAYMEDRENSIAFEGRDFFHSGSREAFFYEYKDFSMSPLQLGLLGSWQSSNAACALSAALALQKKRPLSTQSMQTGLIKAKLPGRLEMWKNDKDQKVWID
ncbi:MAG: hypothetical protein KDD52_08770, partial [Bdellovibrionales bacterium]|nr:hypothetical protein [Bdellovibrionales bacterium]